MQRLVVLALLAGCYNPTVAVGGPCSDQGFCPSGQMCIAGRCVVTAPEVDSAIDTPLIDSSNPPIDAKIDAPPAIDAAPDAFISPTWLTLTPIPGVNTSASEGDPSLTPNRLTIVFQRSNDLYIGVRTTITGTFSVSLLTALSSPVFDEASPEINANGTTIYFTSNRATGQGDVFKSTLSSGTWSAPVMDNNLSSPTGDDTDLAISPDELTAFVSRDGVLMKSTRATTASAWSSPVTTGTAWGTNASSPSINAAGDVYLHANNPRDLFVSRRAGNGSYPNPSAITELNTATRDAAPFVSADDLYMAIEHDGDLYETHR